MMAFLLFLFSSWKLTILLVHTLQVLTIVDVISDRSVGVRRRKELRRKSEAERETIKLWRESRVSTG
jgi:hypothetical protein